MNSYHRIVDWRKNLLTSESEIIELLRGTRSIAVLGIKPETHSAQPAFYVSKYMKSAGYKIIPVPVYFPDVTEILGEKVFRKLIDIPTEVDNRPLAGENRWLSRLSRPW